MWLGVSGRAGVDGSAAMALPPRYSPSELLALVADAVATVSPAAGAVSSDTALIGPQAVLDSVGFVTLLVCVEQKLEGRVDLAASFMAQTDPESADNPFRTAGALAGHLQQLLAGSQ